MKTTPRKIFLWLVLLIGTVFYQGRILERQQDRILENEATDLSRLSSSSMIIEYMVSLPMGVLRAVVIDWLWLEYIEAKDNMEYFKAAQTVDLLTGLQPRYSEIWDFLAWDSAYNLAATMGTAEEKWDRIRYGLDKLLEGALFNDRFPTMKHQLAYHLWYRATNEDVGFVMNEYIVPFLKDTHVQRRFLDPVAKFEKLHSGPHPYSPFEIAIAWDRKARDQLIRQFAEKGKPQTMPFLYTDMGQALDLLTLDSYIRDMMYYQAMLEWSYFQDIPKARNTLQKAIEHLQSMLTEYKPYDYPTNLYATDCERYIDYFSRVSLLLSHTEPLSDRSPREQHLRILSEAEAFLASPTPGYPNTTLSSNDLGHKSFIETWVTALKQSLGGDVYEYNDVPVYAITPPNRTIPSATLAPLRTDRDFYTLHVQTGKTTDPVHTVTVRFKVDSGLVVRVRINDSAGQRLAEKNITGEDTLTVQTKPNDTGIAIEIDHPGESFPWSPTAAYSFHAEIQ